MSLTASIAGVSVDISAISRPDRIDQKTICTVTVIDSAGTAFYQRGQPITITDSILGTIFTGFIHNPQATILYPSVEKLWTLDCIQVADYLAGKRTSNKNYANQYAGTVVVDQVQRYGAAEGLRANAALRWDELQSDWASGTLTNTVATTNASDGNPGDGDLELALVGASVTINPNFATDGTLTGCSVINGSLAPTPTNAIKIVGTQSVPGNGNSYTYWKVWQGSAPTINGQYLHYDIWIDPSSPQAMIGVDIVFTDGTTLRDANSGNDAQNLSPHPKTDLSGVAVGQWYHRRFGLSNLNGKTISYVSVAIEGDNSGTYTGWIKNIQMADFYQISIYANFFNGTLNTAQQMQTNGYSNTSVTVIPTYALAQYNSQIVGPQTPNSFLTNNVEADYAIINSPNWYGSYSVDAAKILSTSYMAWTSTDTTAPNTQTVVSYWLDGWGPIQAAENTALPNLPPGLNLAGRTLSLCVQFFALKGATPEVAPSLSVLQCSIYSAYAATKQDASLVVSNWQGWGNGTFINTIAHPIIDLPQPQPFKNIGVGSSLAGFDLFSSDGAATQTATSSGLQLANATNTDVRSRMTYAGQFMNGVIYAQVTVSATMAGGVVYRCSNWGPNNNSYAYSVTLTTTQLLFGKGSNSSGAGAFTSIATLTQSLTAGTVHTLVVQFIGSAHLIYVDGTTPALVAIDSTYMGPGYCGFRAYNSGATAQNVTFNGFAVNSGNALALNGAIRNWDDATFASQSTYNASPTANNRAYEFQCPATSEARVRMDWAGVYADFTMEFDMLLDTVGPGLGCVYRTTNWVTADSTWAYGVEMTTTSIKLNRAPNSGTTPGTTTTVASATLSLASGNWHHLKLVVVGISHKIYVDDVLMINATDSTFTSAGWVGLRNRNTLASAYNAQFDNFGIVSALSGSWTSSSLSLASVGTYGTSIISWRDQSSNPSACTNTVQTSIDGGTTWQTCTNGGVIPNFTVNQSLAGVSLLVRANLSTTTASVLPGIDNLNVQVLGQYNATGTRVSPALSLAGVGRAGSALVNWNANTPTGTSLAVATSIDGGSTWQSVTAPGNSVTGITTQGNPTFDNFSTNTSANYTQTNQSTGSAATWTWDTANSRVVATGGSRAFLLVQSLSSVSDVDLIVDMNQTDVGGLAWRVSAGNNNYYQLIVNDSQSTNVPNDLALFKCVSGTRSYITDVGATFVRGTYRRIRVTMIGSVITVYMDGVQIFTYTDTSPLAAGSVGLANDGGTSRFYSFRAQSLGQSLAGVNLLTKLTLTSTNPTLTPQVLDMQTFVSSPDIGPGILIPSKGYQRTFLDANIADLNKQSNYWTNFRNDNSLIFQARQATPAPFVLSSLNSQVIAGQTINDVLVNGAELDNSGDSYRNHMVMKGAIATSTFTEMKKGDGSTQTWNVSHPLSAPPTSIVFNGQTQTFGVKGIDSGKQFYYQIGSTAIDQDTSQPVPQGTDSFTIVYAGSFSQDVVLDNTSMAGTITQSMMATIENSAGGSSSGIVEAVLDVSGTPTTVAAATTQGNQLLQRFGNIGRTFKCKTLRSGFAPGQQVSLFVPEFNLNNVQMLITEVDVSIVQSPGVTGGLLYTWQLTMMEGANLGTWVQLFTNLVNAL